MQYAVLGPGGMEVPSQASRTLTVMLIYYNGYANDLCQFLFSLNEVKRAIFNGISFQFEKTTKALFLEEGWRESECRGDAADRLAGILRGFPSIKKPALSFGGAILSCHYHTNPKSAANDQSEPNLYMCAKLSSPRPP
jgi:hypothetical protein